MSIIICHLGVVVELLCPGLHNIILLLMGRILIGISLLPPNMQKNIFKEEEDGFHPTPKKKKEKKNQIITLEQIALLYKIK